MGIEPTSEAWEASIKVQNVRIGGILTFFRFLKWIPPPNNTIGGGLKGESTDSDHKDWLF